jgi:hypothetical protein
MSYFPALKRARPARRYQLGPYLAVVFSDCVSMGTVQYTHVLFVLPENGTEPRLAVAAEVNTLHGQPGFEASGSHFLGVFPGSSHENLGASDDWADLERFTRKALELAAGRLGVADAPQEIT